MTIFSSLTLKEIAKRTRFERVLDTGKVTTHHGIKHPVSTMADLLAFVERVAELTANDPEHKKFGELEVSIYDEQLEFDWDTSRPATAEELKEAAEYLSANPCYIEGDKPIKWQVNYNNGDTNND